MVLLAVAGNETTRNAISHGMHAFFQNPDQWELYKSTRPATAGDEIIRWATPVTVFQRTAINDVEVGGQPVAEGERVGMFYASANFDEDVFTDPFRFDITRDPNPHQAFGGHGAHYCIGANLARLEVNLIFDALADRLRGSASSGSRDGCGTAGSTVSRTCRSPTASSSSRRSTDVTERRPARGLRLHRPRHPLGGDAARAVPGAAAQRAGLLGRAAAVLARRHGRGGRHRLLGGVQARRGRGGLQGQQELLQLGERRDHPLPGGDAPRDGRDAAGDAAQPGPARAHRDPAHHLPRLHAAGDRRRSRRS